MPLPSTSRPEIAALPRGGYGLAQRNLCVRVFHAQVDVSLGGANGHARNGHALDEAVRIALHQHAVGEGARIAFVGIADHVLLVGRLVQDRLPLDTGGECGAAASTQPGIRHFLDHLRAGHAQCALQALVSAVRHVLVNVDRIDEAHPRKGQALLAGDVRQFIDYAEAKRVFRTLAASRLQAVSRPVPPPPGRNPRACPPTSTSTRGSSQTMPREPIRTSSISVPLARDCSSSAVAVSSAPSATAAASLEM